MITVQETTKWAGNYPNHKYILSDNKQWMYGFIRNGETFPKIFNRPIQFDIKGRTFQILIKTRDIEPGSEIRYVKGSNGNEYTVTKENNRYTCTCPAFTFRHTCKHIESIK